MAIFGTDLREDKFVGHTMATRKTNPLPKSGWHTFFETAILFAGVAAFFFILIYLLPNAIDFELGITK